MKRFLPSDLSEEFSLHIEKLNPSSSGSLLEIELAYPISLHSSDVPKLTHSKHIKLPDQFVISSFESDMLIEVLSLYRKTYSFMDGNFKLPSCFRRYNTINVMSRVYYSTKHDSKPNLYLAQDVTNQCRPVIVKYFASHYFTHDGKLYNHILANVIWLKCHPKRYEWGKPLEVWYMDDFDLDDQHSHFIHLCTLCASCVYLCTSIPI